MTDRKPIIAGNWKMHHDHYQAIQVTQKLSYQLDKTDYERVDVVVAPPFTDLRSLQTVLDADSIPIALGAQNCHHEDSGAFTGEVSPVFLAKLGVRYVIVGHSERRELFGESDEDVNRKARAVLKHGMIPILCCGETLEEREADGAESKVRAQVTAGLAAIPKAQVAGLVIAYEPIWAIGTGRTASADDAQSMCALIRGQVAEVAGATAAGAVRIQYGGSVKPGNIAELMACDDIDGALVGGASLDPDDFARMIRYG
ncbi:MAG: triose-phosphate isomerase [Actinomycetes bacterium]